MTWRPARAQQVFADRRRRDEIFGAYVDGFGEPAWDVLLLLYIKGRGVSTRDLGRAIGCDVAIAKTYVDWLASRDLVLVTGDVAELLEAGRRPLDQYLDDARAGAGTPKHPAPVEPSG